MTKSIGCICQIFVISLAVIMTVSCEKPGVATSSNLEKRRKTEDFINREVNEPDTIGGMRRESDFIQNVYVPGLQKARGLLDKLQRGEVRLVPIVAFVRPTDPGIQLLWMMWLQSDNDDRTVVLLDKDGEFGRFTEPSNEITKQAFPALPSYVHMDFVLLSVLASTQPNQHPSNGPSTVVTRRVFDTSSIQVDFSNGSMKQAHMNVIKLDAIERD